MSHFDRLHPALQHHIVNSLGWRSLRPFQEAVIPPILDGEHLIVLAPTAGGKTEAAFFPVVSRMLEEEWSGLSVLYLCPIKALLNNLSTRLERYARLLGRRTALWHGDIKAGARRAILRDPPDLLLTTPESLEVMLVSPTVDSRRLFSQLQVVIIDEIHAFAGDDRGWHLLSVLERASRLAGRELQRIGLSATVGNPTVLVDWLAGGPRQRPRRVCLPPPGATPAAEVKLDHVGSLANAALVVSRLHRGEKRLVFIDSRAKAERLGQDLRQLGVTAFVTHSSLSQEQRHQAEEAFAHRDDCVIVATSVLELGVDVGDLDRVIQVDSPATVSSFLQRMGRTGRRAGSTRNCLFLTTNDESLMQAAGLIDLWESGYVEPIEPPVEPYHVLAQQLLALVLQERGIGRRTWWEWVAAVPGFAALPPGEVERLVTGMLSRDLVWEEQGILGMGRAGEATYGRRNFLEVLSVFLSPPLFAVTHGREPIGFVDELTFHAKSAGPRVLLLGGRAWLVTYVDWSRKVAYVEPSEHRGQSRWQGDCRALGYRVCQAIRGVLAGEDERAWWSKRAAEQLRGLRCEYEWLSREPQTELVSGAVDTTWWTFAGLNANACLAPALAAATGSEVTHESFGVTFAEGLSPEEIDAAIASVRERPVDELVPTIEEEAVRSLKFAECLPEDLAVRILQRRLRDEEALAWVLKQKVRSVKLG